MIALAAMRLVASAGSAVWRFLRTPYGQILAVVLIFGGLSWWHGERRFADGVASMAPKLERANSDLGQCRSNTSGLTASITAQNAALEAARKAGADMLAKSSKAVSEAQGATQEAEKRAFAIMSKKPVGFDACQRALEADDLILGSVK